MLVDKSRRYANDRRMAICFACCSFDSEDSSQLHPKMERLDNFFRNNNSHYHDKMLKTYSSPFPLPSCSRLFDDFLSSLISLNQILDIRNLRQIRLHPTLVILKYLLKRYCVVFLRLDSYQIL